eukprot:c1984_g1_i2.p1 GENE.c1984_g1_i2~~c1984_g1_i2.p1  ORF type:complete len:435 (+),score=100.69 c1984_g1_i2:43-1347(+)
MDHQGDVFGIPVKDPTTNQQTDCTEQLASAARGSSNTLDLRDADCNEPHKFLLIQKALTSNQSLTTVNLSRSKVHNPVLAQLSPLLAHHPALHSLTLTDNPLSKVGALVEFLVRAPSSQLSLLDLSRCGIGDGGMAALSKVVSCNTLQLTSLSLARCGITREGAHHLGLALNANSSLLHLNLHDNELGAEGVDFIMQGVCSASSALTSLNLAGCGLSSEGGIAVGRALIHSHITSLNISNNRLCDEGGEAVIGGVIGTHITTLYLAVNEISDSVCGSVCQMLQCCPHLSHLILAGNALSNKGVDLISNALATNTCLTSLSFACNFVSNDGASSLARALATNTCLKSMNLFANHVTERGATNLLKALKNNRTMCSLSLESNFVSVDHLTHLRRCLSVNENAPRVHELLLCLRKLNIDVPSDILDTIFRHLLAGSY